MVSRQRSGDPQKFMIILGWRSLAAANIDLRRDTRASCNSQIDAIGKQHRQRVEYFRHLEGTAVVQQDSCRADADATGVCGDRRDRHFGTGDLQVRTQPGLSVSEIRD
jgi:hypothetical protein